MMKILVIDDRDLDFAALKAALRMLPLEAWTGNIEFVHAHAPLSDVAGYNLFAGVILDLHLAGKSGISVSADIANATKFMVPILLATGEDRTNIPYSVRGFCDAVAFKNDMRFDSDDNAYLWALRSWMRNCWRLYEARFANRNPGS